jgi:transcriptional regulator with XRE-family HTH domain
MQVIHDISRHLTELMRARGVSQNALSRATGVSQPTINRILCKVTLKPSHDSIARLAKFFGVTPDSMYGPLLTDPYNNTAVSVDELLEKISALSDNEKSDLIKKVRVKDD